MPCTEAYREHILYTFNGYCKTVMRYADMGYVRECGIVLLDINI